MKLVSASFYFRNDAKDGLGLTFGPSGFTPEELDVMFGPKAVAEYFQASDESLGTNVVADYFGQLSEYAKAARKGPLPMGQALIAAWNIMYLVDRGFLVNDEYNGTLFTYVE